MKVPASSAAADRGASPLRRSILVPLGGVALIAAHLALGNAGSWRKSAAFDENARIGSGFSFWATQDFRLGPEAVLTQRWLALPVYTLSKDELRRALHGPPAEAHPLPARSSDPLPYFVSNP